MQEPKVSFIIPAYNVEKYISQCLESILAILRNDIEIIVVDDGSTDGTSNICENYSQKDSRIIVFKNQNQGVSASRNFGLSKAKGKFVVFVDSDDYIDSNKISNMIDNLDDKCQGILFLNIVIKDVQQIESKKINPTNLASNELIPFFISDINSEITVCENLRAVWGKFYLKEIIDKFNIKFDSKSYIGEDAIFNIKYFSKVENIKASNEYGYFYRILETSAVRKYKEDFLEQLKIQLDFYESVENKSVEYCTAVNLFTWGSLIDIWKNYHKYSYLKRWIDINWTILKRKININYIKSKKIKLIYIICHRMPKKIFIAFTILFIKLFS